MKSTRRPCWTFKLFHLGKEKEKHVYLIYSHPSESLVWLQFCDYLTKNILNKVLKPKQWKHHLPLKILLRYDEVIKEI